MLKLHSILFCIFCLSSGLAANILVLIDVSDFSNVTFTATGAAPTRDELSQNTLDGVSFKDLMTTDQTVFLTLSGDFAANGTDPFNQATYIDIVTDDSGRDVNMFLFGFDSMNFVTTESAFSGSSRIDFTDQRQLETTLTKFESSQDRRA